MMGEYYNGVNREREKEQGLMDKVCDWWDSLSSVEQLWIWKRENKLTDEDMQGQKDIANDAECHRKMVEGSEIE